MSQFLGVSEKKQLGITCILSPKWMFLAFIERPYHYEQLLDIPGAKSE